MQQKNDIIEHLYRKGILNDEMRDDIYRYFDFLDSLEKLHQ